MFLGKLNMNMVSVLLLTLCYLHMSETISDVVPTEESGLQKAFDGEESIGGNMPALNRKIYKGTRVSILEHPYVVSIRRQYAHYLVGTILSKYVVISVAHPLISVPVSELSVICGENYADRGTVMFTVLLVIINKEFNEYTLVGDVSLIRIYEPINFKPVVRPISNIMRLDDYYDSNNAFVTGWGRCDLSGKEMCLPRASKWFPNEKFDPMLRSITFPINASAEACKAYAQFGLKLGEGMLCAGESRALSPGCPCMAVPGAPLVMAGDLLGVQSWGFGCGYTTDLPAIYTDLRVYYSWLEINFKYLTENITSDNLQLLFEATKAAYVLQWLDGTRPVKVLLHQHPDQNLHPWEVDRKLARISGVVWDIRDYLNMGKYHAAKRDLYYALQKELFKHNSLLSTVPTEPTTTTTDSGLETTLTPQIVKLSLSEEYADYPESVEAFQRHHKKMHGRKKTTTTNTRTRA